MPWTPARIKGFTEALDYEERLGPVGVAIHERVIDATKASARQVGGGHYKDFPIQPGEFIYKNKLDWFEGNAVKYICRHKVKGGRVDIEKAIHYLELLLEKEYDNDQS